MQLMVFLIKNHSSFSVRIISKCGNLKVGKIKVMITEKQHNRKKTTLFFLNSKIFKQKVNHLKEASSDCSIYMTSLITQH